MASLDEAAERLRRADSGELLEAIYGTDDAAQQYDLVGADLRACSKAYYEQVDRAKQLITVEALKAAGFEEEFPLIAGCRLKHKESGLFADFRYDYPPMWAPWIPKSLLPQNMADVDYITARLSRA